MKSLNAILVLSVLSLTAACRGPLPNNDVLWNSGAEKLKASKPVDIAVLPPRDMTNRVGLFAGIAPGALPLKDIRQIAYKGLIQRRYTPLSLEFVDRAFLGKAAPTEASFGEIRERCNADAILTLTINRWDNAHLSSDKLFSIGAEAYLVDAKTGETIWQGRSDWDMVLDKEPDIDRVNADELQRRGIERFFARLLQQLPIREVN